mgnify:CR=1 FL=1
MSDADSTKPKGHVDVFVAMGEKGEKVWVKGRLHDGTYFVGWGARRLVWDDQDGKTRDKVSHRQKNAHNLTAEKVSSKRDEKLREGYSHHYTGTLMANNTVSRFEWFNQPKAKPAAQASAEPQSELAMFNDDIDQAPASLYF